MISRKLLNDSIKEHKDFMEMVCENKYGHKNIKDVIEGVISYCNIKDKDQKELLRSGKFIPAGSILSACNTDTKGSFSNCYYVPVRHDSIEGIFDAHKEIARTFSYRGGVGTDITILRPKEERVNNTAKTSSGAVSFMPSFSELTKTIGQNGRRGALLISIDIRHPDSLDFIWSKADPARVFEEDIFTKTLPDISNANITLKLSDSFMQAVENDDNFTFCFPDIDINKDLYDSKWDGDYDNWLEIGGRFKEYRTLKARDVLSQISEASHICGDPGVAFIDTIQKNTFGTYIHKSLKPLGFNACFSGDTLIPTSKGAFSIKDIVGKYVKVFDGEEWIECDNFRQTNSDQKLYRITLSDGTFIDATNYHTMYLENNIKTKVSKLKEGDKLLFDDSLNYNGNIEEKGSYLKGFMCGDGFGNLSKGRAQLLIYPGKECCMDRIKDSLNELPIIRNNTNTITDVNYSKQVNKQGFRYALQGITARDGEPFKGNIYKWGTGYKSRLPKETYQWSYESKCNFIAGVFDSDGCCVDGKNGFSYQLSSIRKEFLIDFLLLLKSIGVHGRIGLMHNACEKEMPGGKYFCNDCYRLTIPQKYSIVLAKQINFSRLKDFSGRSIKYNVKYKYNTITNIKELGNEHDVYCCTLPSTHKILTSTGIITGNCGEQPMGDDSNCLLSAFVLPLYVKGDFDGELFENDVEIATQIMNIFSDINQEKHPLQEQRSIDVFGKRIGIELTGFGDTCSLLGLRYGSIDSKLLAEMITDLLISSQLRASCDTAIKDGCCKAMETVQSRERFLKNSFVEIGDDLECDIIDYGLANTSFNTIGPCGSISIISGNCTSGIEPLFKFSYKRKNRIDNKEYEFIHLPACKRMLENFDEFEGLSLQEAKEKLNYIEADEIPWKDRVNVQSALQKNIDASISSTINLHEDTSPEIIQEIYIYAWKKGLKGITVFRDGCKEGILSSTEPKKQEEVYTIPEVFEKELLDTEEAIRHRVVWKKSKLYVNVSIDDDNNPIEIFTKLPKEAGINGNGVFNPSLWQEKTSHWDSICRLVSMLLRYSIPVSDIIKQLDRSTYSMVDAAGILKRVLSKYDVMDEIKVSGNGITCKECGLPSYFHEGGCGICRDCGYSECG